MLFGSNLSCGAYPAVTFPNDHLATVEMACEQKHGGAEVRVSSLACGAYPTATFPNNHLFARQYSHDSVPWTRSMSDDSEW